MNQVSKTIVDSVKNSAKKATEVAVGVAKAIQGEVKGVVTGGSGFSKTAPIKSGAKGEKQIDFIKKYWGMAVRISEALGVNPEVILSQFAAETGWGKSVVPGTNNLGNIKAGKSWKGKTVKAYDKIEKSNDPYRVYATPEEFAEDYIKLVGNSKRYKNVIGSHTAEKFYTELKKAGYATDKDYVSKGIEMNKSVMNRLDMTRVKLKQVKTRTPKNSKDLAKFAQSADMPNIQSYVPPSGNPHRGQINSSSMSASNVTIHQSFKTDMTINGAREPIESANAVKRQQENSLAFMARNVISPLVG